MIEVGTINAPAHWACYFVNGDATGFDYYNTSTDNAGDRDMAEADKFLERLAKDGWRVVSCEGESFFGTFNGLGTDLITYIIHRSE